MSVAYLIIAHDPGARLRLLIETLLEDERSSVYLHLDRKCSDLGWVPGFRHPRFKFIQKHSVNWGGFSMVRATKSLLRLAFEDERNQKFALLSESCFPLKAPAALNASLDQMNGSAFAVWGKIDWSRRFGTLDRYMVTKLYPYDVEALNPTRGPIRRLTWAALKFLIRVVPFELRVPRQPLWKGSMFFVADRELTARFLEDHPELERVFRYSQAPDEMFFTTIFGRYLEERSQPVPLTRFGDDVQGAHFIRKRLPKRSLLQKLTSSVDTRRLFPSDIPDALASGALFARKCDLEACKLIKLSHSPAASAPADGDTRVKDDVSAGGFES